LPRTILESDELHAKKISIGFTRTCDCAPSHINCLTAKEWVKCQVGVWQFSYEGRDIRNKKLHPAAFPISLASKVISLFSHKGELVLDPFVGSGTTLLSAQDLDRNAIGFDLQGDYVRLCQDRLASGNLFNRSQQIAVQDDARNIPSYLEPGTVSLILTSPPYANLLNRKRKNKSRRGCARKNDQFEEVEQYSQDAHTLRTKAIEDCERGGVKRES